MPDVLLHPDVDRWLNGQQPDIEDRIRVKLKDAGDDPERFLRPLTGRDTYKLRIGVYRAEIEWVRARDELRVLDVGHRDGFWD